MSTHRIPFWIIAALSTPMMAVASTGCESTDINEDPFVRGTPSDGRVSDPDAEDSTEADLPVLDGYCKLNPIMERNRICASVLMPTDSGGTPEKISVHIFPTDSPTGEPSVRGKELINPDQLSPFVAGSEVAIILENIPSEGQGYLIATVFMPGGGLNSNTPASGIDYVGVANFGAPVVLNGDPLNVDSPIILSPSP